MSLRKDFKNVISKLSHEELIKIATDGILANVYYIEKIYATHEEYVYCFTYRDFDNVTYIITDNEIELSNFIYNHLLGNFTLSDNIIIFPMNREDISGYNDIISQFPISSQTFRCHPEDKNDWCNRSIKNKKSFVDWMISKDPIEIDDAILEDWRYYAGGIDINEYIKHVFEVSEIKWYSIN